MHISRNGLFTQAQHPTTIVIPGTSQVDSLAPENNYPLRVRIQKTGELSFDTDLLIDQVRAISNSRFQFRLCAAQPNILKEAEQVLRILIGR